MTESGSARSTGVDVIVTWLSRAVRRSVESAGARETFELSCAVAAAGALRAMVARTDAVVRRLMAACDTCVDLRCVSRLDGIDGPPPGGRRTYLVESVTSSEWGRRGPAAARVTRRQTRAAGGPFAKGSTCATEAGANDSRNGSATSDRNPVGTQARCDTRAMGASAAAQHAPMQQH